MLYPELDYARRIERVARFGFMNTEFWGWRDKDIPDLLSVCEETGAKIANFSGHRKGSLVASSTHPLFFSELEDAVTVAQQLQCPTLMLLTNELGSGGRVENSHEHLSHQEKYTNVLQGLDTALAQVPPGIELLLEPLNTTLDHPGYFLDDIEHAAAIIKAINNPRLRLLCDLYHLAVMGEDVVADIDDSIDLIEHFHVADTPGRTEPGSGEVDYAAVFAILEKHDYPGTVGYECSPTNSESSRVVQEIFE